MPQYRNPATDSQHPKDPQRPPSGFGDRSGAKPSGSDRAAPARPPELPKALAQAEAERERELQRRTGVERRGILRGLVFLAILVLIIALVQAGWDRAFPAGWWRKW